MNIIIKEQIKLKQKEVKDENTIPENYTCSENDIECNLNKQLNKYEVYMTKVTNKKYNIDIDSMTPVEE